MNQVQKELTFDESVAQVMQTLPPPIRNYLGQGKYTLVAKNLMTKYNLRIDQGGVLEREIMLLLMGIETPDEFIQALVEEAKLEQQTVTGIVQDINTQIFVPLREEEMKSGGMKTEPAVQQSPRPTEVPGVVGPPPQSPSYFHLENKLPLVSGLPRGSIVHPPLSALNTGRPPAPVPPRERSSLRDVLAAVTAPAGIKASPAASIQPPASRLLEDHEEPHIEFKKASPPPNLPGAFPPQPYSSDPYREPIDEK